jgi:hypothetical protein
MLDMNAVIKLYEEALEARIATEASREHYKAEATYLYKQADAEPDDATACTIIERADEFAELENRAELNGEILDDLAGILSRIIGLHDHGIRL